jgi:hypothetical protein
MATDLFVADGFFDAVGAVIAALVAAIAVLAGTYLGSALTGGKASTATSAKPN